MEWLFLLMENLIKMNIEKGKEYALNLISARMYTSFEILDKLMRKGYSNEMAKEIVSPRIVDITNSGFIASPSSLKSQIG